MNGKKKVSAGEETKRRNREKYEQNDLEFMVCISVALVENLTEQFHVKLRM